MARLQGPAGKHLEDGAGMGDQGICDDAVELHKSCMGGERLEALVILGSTESA